MRLNRFHGFLIASAALISAVVILSGLLVGQVLERQVLAQEENHTAKVVLSQARLRLTPADFEFAAPGVRRERFEVLLEGLPEVFRLKVFDRRGTIVWSNETQLIGQSFPDSRYVATALKGEIAMVLEAPKRAEHVYERTKGYVAEAYVPITLPGSREIVGVIETYIDSTEIVEGISRAQRLIWAVAAGLGALLYIAQTLMVWNARANELWAVHRLESERRLAALGRLAAGVFHELNNPLTDINARIRLIELRVSREQFPGFDLRSHLVSIEEVVNRMLRIVESLSEYSKSPQPKLAHLNVTGLLTATRELVARQAQESRVTIAVDAPADLPLVWGDRNRLMQVMLNLATNAIEAMVGTGGHLTLKARSEDKAPRGSVRVEVADTGPGIPSDALQKIWEAFYTTKPDGAGLGLSIVRALVAEQPGVTIAVESKPGQNTTFTLTLPRG